MKKLILTILLVFIALAGAVVPAFAESNDMLKSNYENYNLLYTTNITNTKRFNNYNNLFDIYKFNESVGSYSLNYNKTNYSVLGNFNVDQFVTATILDGFRIYELSGTQSSTKWNFDFPIYCVSSSTQGYSSIFNIPNDTICIPIEYEKVTAANVGMTEFNINFEKIVNAFFNTQSLASNFQYVQAGYLKNSGYRIYASSLDPIQNTYINVLVKMGELDNYQASNDTTGNIQQYTQYFQRFDFNILSSSLNFGKYWDYCTLNITSKYPLIFDLSNNISISGNPTLSNNEYIYPIVIYNNGSNSFITFTSFSDSFNTGSGVINQSTSAIFFKNSNSSTISNDYTNQLTSINSNLVLIKNLISDLQVQEINNIYQEITNNYNIDIETNINGLIDNLELNLNNLSIDDPKFSLINSDSNAENKLSVFKQIGTAIINVYDDNGLSYLYFVPIVLLIIGAVIV